MLQVYTVYFLLLYYDQLFLHVAASIGDGVRKKTFVLTAFGATCVILLLGPISPCREKICVYNPCMYACV